MTSPEDRVRSFERMLEKRPEDSRVRFALAVEYLNGGRTEDGVRELRAYLEASDDEGNAWGRLAAALIDLGRPDEARDAYNEGIAAAERYGHPTMAEEFAAELDGLLRVTDAQGVVGVKEGFEEEALPHLDAVYRFALRLSGSSDQAADLVQETFLRAYRSWDQYTRGTRAKSWLFTICRNVFLRGRERVRRHDELVEQNVERDDTLPDPVNPLWASVDTLDPEGSFFDALVDGEILAAVEALPEEYRAVVILSDIEGLAYQEIADLLEVPLGTVKSRLFRGRRRLQEALYSYAVEMGHIPAGAASRDGG